jgi:hypothetical protein
LGFCQIKEPHMCGVSIVQPPAAIGYLSNCHTQYVAQKMTTARAKIVTVRCIVGLPRLRGEGGVCAEERRTPLKDT